MAAIKYLTPIDLNKNELQNPRVQNLATAPSTPVTGQLYYDTDDNILYWYNGSTWIAAKGDTLSYGAVTAQTAYGASSGNGSASTAARSDHTHGTPSLSTNAASALVPGDTATNGTGTAPAKDDHKHSLPSFGLTSAMAPIPSFGSSYDAGVASTFSRTDHTHGLPLHNDAAHSGIHLNALAAPTADISLGGYKITSLGTPSSDTDAATKAYVDSIGAGLTDFKASVRAAATTNVTLASGAQNGSSLGGITLVTGDRILLAGQSSAAENGIYTVNASGAPTRATDANANGELSVGTLVYVEAGTSASTQFVCSATGATPWVPGSSTSTWVVYSTVASNEAGAGLTQSGGVLAVGAGSGITVAADSVAVDTSWLATNVNGEIDAAAGNGLTSSGGVMAVGAGTGITVNANDVAVNTSVVARKYTTATHASATSIAITHSLGNQWVVAQVIDVATNALVMCDIVMTDANTTTFKFNTAPSADSLRFIIVG